MDLGISGKLALVTGAGRGLGREIARRLHREGARLVVAGRSLEPLEALCRELGGRHRALAADLGEEGGGSRLAERILQEAGEPDILVHNVGGSLQVKDPLAPAADWRRVWQINLGSAVELNAALIPPMRRRRWGRVVHISSVASQNFTGYPAYNCAKAAVNGYVKSVAPALAPDNVIVSAVLPGPLRIEGRFLYKLEKEDPAGWAEYVRHHLPIGRLASLEEVAAAAAFLCSDLSGYSAGALLNVDGGNH